MLQETLNNIYENNSRLSKIWILKNIIYVEIRLNLVTRSFMHIKIIKDILSSWNCICNGTLKKCLAFYRSVTSDKCKSFKYTLTDMCLEVHGLRLLFDISACSSKTFSVEILTTNSLELNKMSVLQFNLISALSLCIRKNL